MIVVFGEALIDLVPGTAKASFTAHPGGGPANIAVGLGRLGIDVQLLARLADDQFGAMLRDHLGGSNVGLDLISPSAAPSTLAVLHLDPAGVAAYDFYIDGCADGTWRVDELPGTLPEGAALHVSGSLALANDAMADAAEALLVRERPRRVITFDPNVRPSLSRDERAMRARLERWLGLADIVKASEEDLAWIAPGRPIESVAGQWRDMGPTLVVVTRGGQGAHAVGTAGSVDLGGLQVAVVDTVGAGDAFMSGLLDALEEDDRLNRVRLETLSTDGLTAALVHAQRVAAFTCTRAGADPPWRAELAAWQGGLPA
jgi:fructokinase